MSNYEKQFTSAGTNIDEVKSKNAAAGLSYNAVKELLAKNSGKGMATYNANRSENGKPKT